MLLLILVAALVAAVKSFDTFAGDGEEGERRVGRKLHGLRQGEEVAEQFARQTVVTLGVARMIVLVGPPRPALPGELLGEGPARHGLGAVGAGLADPDQFGAEGATMWQTLTDRINVNGDAASALAKKQQDLQKVVTALDGIRSATRDSMGTLLTDLEQGKSLGTAMGEMPIHERNSFRTAPRLRRLAST